MFHDPTLNEIVCRSTFDVLSWISLALHGVPLPPDFTKEGVRMECVANGWILSVPSGPDGILLTGHHGIWLIRLPLPSFRTAIDQSTVILALHENPDTHLLTLHVSLI